MVDMPSRYPSFADEFEVAYASILSLSVILWSGPSGTTKCVQRSVSTYKKNWSDITRWEIAKIPFTPTPVAEQRCLRRCTDVSFLMSPVYPYGVKQKPA